MVASYNIVIITIVRAKSIQIMFEKDLKMGFGGKCKIKEIASWQERKSNFYISYKVKKTKNEF